MAGRYNIFAEQGSTFNITFTINTDGVYWDLNAYTGRMKIKKFIGSADNLIELTTSNGRMTFDSQGTFSLNITAEDMADLPADKYVYDIEFEGIVSGNVQRILEGKFTIRPEVTY